MMLGDPLRLNRAGQQRKRELLGDADFPREGSDHFILINTEQYRG